MLDMQCKNGCGTTIYWNEAHGKYFEEYSEKQHFCPNWKTKSGGQAIRNEPRAETASNRPKTQTDNSLEILESSDSNVLRAKYEQVSSLVKLYNGKVHGSQFHLKPDGRYTVCIYYEIPEGTLRQFQERLTLT